MEELDEFGLPKDIEPEGCPHCWKNGYETITVENFVYDGTVLPAFTVPSAQLLQCPKCQHTAFHRSESKKWEQAKATEILARSEPLTGIEAKFFRQLLMKTPTMLAPHFGCAPEDVKQWEVDKPEADVEAELRRLVSLALSKSQDTV